MEVENFHCTEYVVLRNGLGKSAGLACGAAARLPKVWLWRVILSGEPRIKPLFQAQGLKSRSLLPQLVCGASRCLHQAGSASSNTACNDLESCRFPHVARRHVRDAG